EVVSVSAQSLEGAALTPVFGSAVSTSTGFKVQIGNYDPAFTWSAAATAGGTATVNSNGVLVVSGVASGTTSQATVQVTRQGYATDSAAISATSLPGPARQPVFGTVARTADGFQVAIQNYSPAFVWSLSATSGSASVDNA